jgi:hypothetical protein
LAKSREVASMILVEHAQESMSKFSSKHKVEVTIPLNALQRSERKLELKEYLNVLKERRKSIQREISEWGDRALHAEAHVRRVEAKLDMTPRRYIETPSDVQRMLISVLSEQEKAHALIGQLENAGASRIDSLKLMVYQLQQELSSVGEDLTEARRSEEHWAIEANRVSTALDPLRDRVRKLQTELKHSHGDPNALLAVSLGALGAPGAKTSGPKLAKRILCVIRDYISPEISSDNSDFEARVLSALNVLEIRDSSTMTITNFRGILDFLEVGE